jgi:hypothetical protein
MREIEERVFEGILNKTFRFHSATPAALIVQPQFQNCEFWQSSQIHIILEILYYSNQKICFCD